MQSRGRLATSLGSSCLRVPAVALRELTKAGSPSSSRCSLSLAKAASFMKTSPRTSRRLGASVGKVRGMEPMVRMLAVMSSPVVPSPRVAAYSS